MLDPLIVGYTGVILLFVFLGLGVPVAVAMGVVGIFGMYFGIGELFVIGQLRTLPFATVNSYGLAVVPLFVLMGVLAEASGITTEVFRTADLWLRRLRGGLYQAVIVGSAVFSAISGSTTVNALVFTRIAFPKMVGLGYSKSLSLGAIAGAGSFAAMIPPSITMVIYAIMTEQSVGQLLIAGLIPGVVTALVYLAGINLLVRIDPTLAPDITEKVGWGERWRALGRVWPIVILILLVMGGIYTGVFPPSAAGAAGAFGAFLFALARMRGVRGWLVGALQDAAFMSCIMFMILVGGLILSRMLVVTGVIDHLVVAITSVADTPLKFMILASVLYILLGCFLDTTSMMVVTLPFLFPVVVALDIDPIWFGIVLVKLIEISVITPPVGFNLFAVMSAVRGQATFGHAYRGVIPFIVLDLAVLVLLIMYPELATWLPETMIDR